MFDGRDDTGVDLRRSLVVLDCRLSYVSDPLGS